MPRSGFLLCFLGRDGSSSFSGHATQGLDFSLVVRPVILGHLFLDLVQSNPGVPRHILGQVAVG